MDTLTVILIFVGLLCALVVGGFLRSGHWTQSTGDALEKVETAHRLTALGVQAAEQLHDPGDDIERFNLVDEFLMESLPQFGIELTAQQRRMMIEAAVFGLNKAQEQGWIPAPGTINVHAPTPEEEQRLWSGLGDLGKTPTQ